MSYLYNQENAHNPPGAMIYQFALEPPSGDKQTVQPSKQMSNGVIPHTFQY